MHKCSVTSEGTCNHFKPGVAETVVRQVCSGKLFGLREYLRDCTSRTHAQTHFSHTKDTTSQAFVEVLLEPRFLVFHLRNAQVLAASFVQLALALGGKAWDLVRGLVGNHSDRELKLRMRTAFLGETAARLRRRRVDRV